MADEGYNAAFLEFAAELPENATALEVLVRLDSMHKQGIYSAEKVITAITDEAEITKLRDDLARLGAAYSVLERVHCAHANLAARVGEEAVQRRKGLWRWR